MFPVHWVAMYIHHFGTPDPMITDEQGRGLLQSMPLESLERFGDALFGIAYLRATVYSQVVQLIFS